MRGDRPLAAPLAGRDPPRVRGDTQSMSLVTYRRRRRMTVPPLTSQLEPAVPRAAAKPVTSTVAKPASQRSVRQRAGAALVESSAVESVLDRILVKRLRPLRADATAARKAYEQQVILRVEADSRAMRLEEEAQQLRVRVQQLETELEAAHQRRAGWFRRRTVSVRPQEA